MKVLLLDNVEKLGKVGDVIEVAKGYARNYLIPRSLAVLATDKQVKHHEERVKKLRQKLEEDIAAKRELAAQFAGVTLIIKKKVTKDGKLFGSITNSDIKKALKEKGLPIKGFEMNLKNLPKKMGKYSVKLDFGFDILENIDLEVKSED